ncbi:MAG: MoxR family ATPase [Pseudotabrizicola sp.]|uniref:ATP-binding protein n=1 Tax=Pseudotabrizicola sp. TaxID=2939647 RepID=UPI002716FEDB|nr:MoxR family ATPase [Pseudotabrizicola sp.]MDO8884538.1 MoxR family ATPase [Pseudotabrizicola sp.]MDP2080478.1 MoxR family ATPase [Pseudotabrizicola sp.]MDZ7573677.1 MoxR family ATPase [Pseudotabrizicola sp.]
MSVNTMPVTTGEAAAVLWQGWQAQTAGGMTASWMLHGRPGIGKTEIVQALAARAGAMLFDLRLTTIEPQDLRGLPYYDHAAQRTVWYRPEDLPDDPGQPSVLFLDELTAAPPALQPTVYGLLQERRIGRHRLPDRCFVVAAGNGPEDGAIAYEMGTALSDRLIHLSLRATAQDWVENYALPERLHPAIPAFIRARPDLLETTAETLQRGQVIACTPRSWARVSAIVTAVADRRLRDVMISGAVGEAPAAEFALVLADIAASVRVDEMIAARPADRWALYPTSLHGLTALTYALIGAVEQSTIAPVIALMVGVGKLHQHRSEPELRSLPLAELCTHGFELLLQKALTNGWVDHFAASPDWQAYARARAEGGV